MPIKPTQDNIEIGPASRADIPALCQLLAILFSQELEFEANQAVQATALTSLFDNPELGTLLIARDGPRPIAMVSLLYTVSTARLLIVFQATSGIVQDGIELHRAGRNRDLIHLSDLTLSLIFRASSYF